MYNGTGGPRTGSLYHVVDLDESLVKDETWFTVTIIVKDDTIVVKINERQVELDPAGRLERRPRRTWPENHGPGTIALGA